MRQIERRKDNISLELELQDIKNKADILKSSLERLQVCVDNLEIEVDGLKTKVMELKKDMAPIQKIFSIATGVVITALVGAIMTLILIRK